MRFKFVKRLGLIALSATITVVFAHAALRAEDDDNSKAGRRVERIEDKRSI